MSSFSTNVRSSDDVGNGDIIRRSASYEPNQWDYNSVQFLNNSYSEEKYGALARDMKEEVRALFNVSEPFAQVKLLDTIEHLGLGYHFEKEINAMLNDMITHGYSNVVQNDGLQATSVLFRLLRQHGFVISADIFKPFTDGGNNFKESFSHDVEGLISLYMASHLSFKGESILDIAAKSFSAMHLKRFTKSKFAEEIAYTMEIPSHWRPQRVEARRYIDIYDKEADRKSILLQFAKLDFNMVQNIHQTELTKSTNWWVREGLGNKLKFARDRVFEIFLSAVFILFQPQFGHIREKLTKVMILVTLLDDVYDVYGFLDELEFFTHMVNRWEIEELENLPNYMKTLFKAISTFVDETARDIQKSNGLDVLPFIRKAWVDLCEAYLVEANWQKGENAPSLAEYINNGWVSISVPLLLRHVLFLLPQVPTKEVLDYLESNPKIIRLASTIVRLCNDLATSTAEQARGNTPTTIQCHMQDAGVSEAKAREHISGVISETWKDLNKEYILCSSFPRPFMEACVNMARTAIGFYQHGDGFGIPTFETKGYIQSLLMKPIDFIGNDYACPTTK